MTDDDFGKNDYGGSLMKDYSDPYAISTTENDNFMPESINSEPKNEESKEILADKASKI